MKTSEQPLLILKPNIGVAIIPTIVIAVIIALVASTWGFFIGMLVGKVPGGIILGFVTFLIVFSAFIFFRYMNLKARRYVFFKEKAEFYEGFLNIIFHSVEYRKITDCILTKTVWDRMFGTGTIRLLTAGHISGGVIIQYIEQPDQMYEYVLKLVGGKKNE